MGNTFAYLMLYAWPLVTVVMFLRLSVPMAAACSIVAGYLVLPTHTSLNLPLLPAYDRELAAALPAFLMALIKTGQVGSRMNSHLPSQGPGHVLPGILPRQPFLMLCVVAIVGGALMTSLTNGDTLRYGDRTLPPLGLYDAGSSILGSIMMILPFFIARKWLAHPDEHRTLLLVLCVAALAYSLPALYEIRMSPQLNRMIYGFFPHDWRQHVRAGGFRPVVFLEHGLRLGIFLAAGLLATVGFMRTQPAAKRGLYLGTAGWLLLTLVLSKNLGAFIIAALLVPAILFLGTRLQLFLAAFLAGAVLLYPMARGVDIVPTDWITARIASFSAPERVGSLIFRFNNEDALLERANERPLFGWGGWGRNRVWSETGGNVSVTDGTWIIIFGQSGWIGYLARFGLLTMPIMFLAFRRRNVDVASSALCLALAANLTDLLPNSGLTPVTWLMAGAVAGRLELKRIEKEEDEVKAAPLVQASPYRRTFPEGTAGPAGAPALRRFGREEESGRRASLRKGRS